MAEERYVIEFDADTSRAVAEIGKVGRAIQGAFDTGNSASGRGLSGLTANLTQQVQRIQTDLASSLNRVNSAIRGSIGSGTKLDLNVGREVQQTAQRAAAQLRDVYKQAADVLPAGVDPKVLSPVISQGAAALRRVTEQFYAEISRSVAEARVAGVKGIVQGRVQLGDVEQRALNLTGAGVGARTVGLSSGDAALVRAQLADAQQQAAGSVGRQVGGLTVDQQGLRLARQRQERALREDALRFNLERERIEIEGLPAALRSPQGLPLTGRFAPPPTQLLPDGDPVLAQRAAAQRAARQRDAAEAAQRALEAEQQELFRRSVLALRDNFDPNQRLQTRDPFGAQTLGDRILIPGRALGDSSDDLVELTRVTRLDENGNERVVPGQLRRVERETIDELEDFNVEQRGATEDLKRSRERRRRAESDEGLSLLNQRLREREFAQDVNNRILSGRAVDVGSRRVVDASGDVFEFLDADRRRGRQLDPNNARDAVLVQEAYRSLAKKLKAEEAASERRAVAAGAGGGGGGRGGRGRFADALFGDGPGGRGGGLFTADRLLRQGTSFAGFAISSAIIGGGIAGIGQFIQEVLDYTDSLRDLEIALGATEEPSQRLVSNLSEISRFAGANVGQALDTAAKGIRAFSDSTDALEDREKVGVAFTEAATQLAVIAGKDIADVSGDLIAVGSAFGIAAGGLNQVNDAVAIAKNEIGGNAAVISQGLAFLSTTAAEAGFSLQETASLVAVINRETDQSGSAIATRSSRILSSFGGNTGQRLIADLNASLSPDEAIDTNGTIRDQLFELTELYPELTAAQQGLVRNQIGGTSSTRELVAIFNNLNEILRANEISAQGAGQGLSEFQRKQDELGALIKRIVGDFKNITTGIAESGLLDIFGLILKTIEPVLIVTRELIQLYNEFFELVPFGGGDLVQSFIGISVAVLAAAKAFQVLREAQRAAAIEAATGSAGAFGGGIVEGLLARSGRKRLAADAAGSAVGAFAANAAGDAAKRAAVRSTAAGAIDFGSEAIFSGIFTSLVNSGITLAQAVKKAVNKIVVALQSTPGLNAATFAGLAAAVLAVSQFGSAVDRLNRAEAQADEALTDDALRDLNNRQRGEQFQTTALSLREASSGFLGRLGDIVFNDSAQRNRAEALEKQAKVEFSLDEQRRDVRRRAARSGDSTAGAISFLEPDGVSSGLKLLADSGRSADTQLDALIQSLRNLSEASAGASFGLDAVSQDLFGATLSQKIADSLRIAAEEADAADAFGLSDLGNPVATLLNNAFTESDSEKFAKLDFESINEQAQTAAALAFRESGGRVTPEFNRKAADRLTEALSDDLAGLSEEARQSIIEQFIVDVAATAREFAPTDEEALRQEIDAAVAAAPGLAQSAGQFAELSARLSGAQDAEGKGLARQLARLKEIRVEVVNKGADAKQLERFDQEILAVEFAIQQGILRRIQALASFEASQLPQTDVLGRIGIELQSVQRQLAANTDEGTELELLAKQADLLARQRDEQLRAAAAERLQNVDPRNTIGRLRAELTNAIDRRNAISDTGDRSSAAFFEAQRAVDEAILAEAQEYLNIVASRRLANVDPRDSLGRLTAEVRNARDNLSIQLEGTAEFEQARLELQEAIIAEQEGFRRRNQARRRSGIDPRDTLGRARDDVRAARENLSAQIPGTEEYYVALEELRQAQLSVAQLNVSLADAVEQSRVDPRSQVETARASLNAAKRNLEIQLRGTPDYFTALAEVRQAQIALGDALAEAAKNAALLATDITDPVKVAEVELKAAQDRVRRLIAEGAPEDVVNEARLDERRTAAEAERAAFQQRISDLNVDLQLGRITQQEYIRKLKEYGEQLRSLPERTRQQQELLNDIDLAIKAAEEALTGQFNLGDIRVPTPFEVRRAIAEGTGVFTQGGGLGSTSTVVTNNNIQIDGADVATVKRIIVDTLGPGAASRVVGTRRV